MLSRKDYVIMISALLRGSNEMAPKDIKCLMKSLLPEFEWLKQSKGKKLALSLGELRVKGSLIYLRSCRYPHLKL